MSIRSICIRGTIALAVAVAGCGDDPETAGAPAPFSIAPGEITYTGIGAGNCPGGGGVPDRIYVYGGAGPYRVDNTAPGTVTVFQTSVSGPGGYFEIVVTPGAACPFEVPVVVVDQLNKIVTLKVKGAKGSGT